MKGENPVVLLELTLRHLASGDVINHQDFIDRVDTLAALGQNVLVSNFRRFHRLSAYLARYTDRPLGIAIGASKLREIFDESFYNEEEGGLLGGLGQLFRNGSRLYVYPSLDFDSGTVRTAEAYGVAAPLKHLYAHLLENGAIRGIRKYDSSLLKIRSRDVLQLITVGNAEWEQLVAEPIISVIKDRRLFGWRQ